MTIMRAISRVAFYFRRRGHAYWRIAVGAVIASVLSSPIFAANTIVRMEIAYGTNQGTIDIELYDDLAPKTVANFLRYAGRGDYTTNGFIHRSVKTITGASLLIQGGGYAYIADLVFGTHFLHITEDPPVQNEFSTSRSNVRGTIAMAKIPSNDQQGNPIPGGGPDSATSEWFINLADNGGSPNTSPPGLDYQNGGFTVFGRVSVPGMAVVDAIANLQTLQLYLPMTDGSQTFFGDLPLANYDPTIGPQLNNLVKVTSIPNVAATFTSLGTWTIFTSDVDMVFNSVGTVDTATAVSRLGSFTSSPNQSVYFNNGMFTLMMSGVMGVSGRVVTLYDGATNRPTRYYAYGKTQDNQTDHWYDFTYDGETGAEIKNNRIILHFVDGKRGDDDLDPTNNSITHTGAQAVVTENASSSSQAGGGCSIVTTPSQTSRGGDWIVVSLFLALLALIRRRTRNGRIQRAQR